MPVRVEFHSSDPGDDPLYKTVFLEGRNPGTLHSSRLEETLAQLIATAFERGEHKGRTEIADGIRNLLGII